MLGKLAFRNVKRSVKDYLVYVLTMTFVTALMFAFNSILFSRDVQALFEVAGLMAAMVGIATFFIVLIVAWLINYMIRFMLEKRSQEFGIYLLLGMKKKKIASLYIRPPSGVQQILHSDDCRMLCRLLPAGAFQMPQKI